MIDIATETVVRPIDAILYCPERRKGVRPNIATIWRWMQTGICGIRLESIMVGATRCTSVQALQRFFDALTIAADAEQAPAPPPVPASRRKSIDAAKRRLATAAR